MAASTQSRSGYQPRVSWIVIGAALVASPAFSQPDSDALDAARACIEIENDADRLDCLDSALTATARADGQSAAETAEPQAEIEPKPPQVSQSNPDSESEPEPEIARSERVEQPAVAAADVEGRADQQVHIRVVEIRRNALGVTTFVADSGARWVQGSGASGRYPAVPFDAVLEPAMGDSWFLASPLGGRRVRVTEAR